MLQCLFIDVGQQEASSNFEFLWEIRLSWLRTGKVLRWDRWWTCGPFVDNAIGLSSYIGFTSVRAISHLLAVWKQLLTDSERVLTAAYKLVLKAANVADSFPDIKITPLFVSANISMLTVRSDNIQRAMTVKMMYVLLNKCWISVRWQVELPLLDKLTWPSCRLRSLRGGSSINHH